MRPLETVIYEKTMASTCIYLLLFLHKSSMCVLVVYVSRDQEQHFFSSVLREHKKFLF